MPIGIYNHKPHLEKTKEKIANALKGHPIYRNKTRNNNIRIALMGKKHPLRVINKISNSLKGNQNSVGKNLGKINGRYKHGYYCGNVNPRLSRAYKLWRKCVFERDDYTCRECSTRNGNGKAVILNADHIKPFATYPELRFDIDNGRTLCLECHKKTDSYLNSRVVRDGM